MRASIYEQVNPKADQVLVVSLSQKGYGQIRKICIVLFTTVGLYEIWAAGIQVPLLEGRKFRGQDWNVQG